MTLATAKLYVIAIAALVGNCIITIAFISSISYCLTVERIVMFSLWYCLTLLLGILAMGIVISSKGNRHV